MHVKTFTGKSITTLLAQIKQEFGSGAVVLSTREFKDNNQVLHEMVVGIEETPVVIPSVYKEVKEHLPLEKEGALLIEKQGAMPEPSLSELWQKKIDMELASLKEHIFTALRPTMRLEMLTIRQKIALEYLFQEGITEHVAMLLYGKMLQEPDNAPIDTLSEIIPLRSWGEAHWRNRVHCVVGTSGVGKSSSLLRMAIALSKENKDLRVLMITMDTERSSGKFFLRYFAGLSNIAYQEASTKEELQEILRTSNAERVLIDIPIMPAGYTLARYLRKHGLEHANVHIVLCAGASQRKIEHTLSQYRAEVQCSIVWTKLDEVCSYGTILNTAIVSGIPISSISFGAGVQNTLLPVSEAMLWKILFKHQLPG